MTNYSDSSDVPWNSYRSSIQTIVIKDGVTSIGSFVFSGCLKLPSVSIPTSVKSIGEYSFQDCSGLSELTIPDSVTSIGKSAFQGCSKLTEITIPLYVTSIDEHAFASSGLSDVYYKGNSDPGSSSAGVFLNTQITFVNVPSSLQVINSVAPTLTNFVFIPLLVVTM